MVTASICGPVAATMGGAGGGGGGGAGLLPQKDIVSFVLYGVHVGHLSGDISPRCSRSFTEGSQMKPKRSWCKLSRYFRVQWSSFRGAEPSKRGKRWAGHGPVTVSRGSHGRNSRSRPQGFYHWAIGKVLTRDFLLWGGFTMRENYVWGCAMFRILAEYMSC